MVYASMGLLGLAVLMAAWPPFRLAVVIVVALITAMVFVAALTWALLTTEGGVAPFILGAMFSGSIVMLLLMRPERA